ncbi:solute carrier family 2, facilitated glucose transporter member 11-like [Neosynchiropus ocellatus]
MQEKRQGTCKDMKPSGAPHWDSRAHEQRQCPLIIALIFVSGIGGTFQFGFGISVMTSPSVFIKVLVNETALQRYDVVLSERELALIWSFMVSIFAIGGFVGSLLAGWLLSYGRKRCLLLNNVFAIIGSALMISSKPARSFEMIMVGRFIYGVNAGVCISAHTLYVVECTPTKLRGMVGVTVGSFISLGKFTGQLLGLSQLLGSEHLWPWLLGFNGAVALLQLLALPFMPESPKFLLLERGDQAACEKSLTRLCGSMDVKKEVEEILKEKSAVQNVRSHSVIQLIREKSLRWQLATTMVAFTALQLSGINAVYFYSFEVFREAGIQEDKLRFAALGTGLCELTTSIICFMIIGRFGKKVLLIRGYSGMSITLVLLTITLNLQSLLSWMPYCSMVLVFFFIFFFCIGPAGVTAPLPGELFTQPYRAAAYTIAASLNWTGLFLLGMVFPVLVEHLKYYCFIIFLFFCITICLYSWFCMPETANRTPLEIAEEFKRMHSKSADTQGKPSAVNNNLDIVFVTQL